MPWAGGLFGRAGLRHQGVMIRVGILVTRHLPRHHRPMSPDPARDLGAAESAVKATHDREAFLTAESMAAAPRPDTTASATATTARFISPVSCHHCRPALCDRPSSRAARVGATPLHTRSKNARRTDFENARPLVIATSTTAEVARMNPPVSSRPGIPFRRGLDEAALARGVDGLGPSAHLEFAHDVAHVELRRRRGDEQLLADFVVG
jgi:hypothetical protein